MISPIRRAVTISLFAGWIGSQSLAGAAEPSLRIPLIAGAETNWPASAFQVAALTPRPPTQPPNASHLALAWSPEGLKVWVDVADRTPDEASSADKLWMADSIELFVASPSGSKNFIQLMVAPGRVAGMEQPRWFYVNQQSEKKPLKDPEIRVDRREDGYRMFILFPWSNLLAPPQEGESIGLQLYLNDSISGKGNSRLVWYPAEENTNPANYYSVQLASKASEPQDAVAWLQIEKLSSVKLSLAGSADRAGQPIFARLTGSESWSDLGVFGAGEKELSRFSGNLPANLADAAKAKLEIKAGTTLLPSLEIPDVRTLRQKVLRKTEVVAKPSIFGTPAFPPIGFLNSELAEAVFGPVEIKVRWFNGDYQEVTKADKAGRYGALVDIQTADGLTDQRRITLYSTGKPFSTRTERYETSLRLPDAFGLPAEVTQRESGLVDDFLNSRLHSLAQTDAGWAVLLAGLQDANRHPESLHGLDAWAMNEDWWYGLEKKLGTAKPYQALTYLPKDYEADKTKTWPLVLFLHGSGERGDDLNKVKKNGLTKLLDAGKEFPFITLAPQCPEEEWWSANRLDDLANETMKRYRVDPRRIYVTGISMGGYGTWNLAGHYPEKYAAAVPVCGGGLPDLGVRLKQMPVWAFHGADDVTVPPQASQRIVEAIRKAGGDPQLTLYPGVGHNSWDNAYQKESLGSWFLRHSLD